VARDEGTAGEDRRSGRREVVERHVHTAAMYFGLADDPDRSRYGDVSTELDALRARVAKLEAQVRALSRDSAGGSSPRR
jgi:hypothetical protein